MDTYAIVRPEQLNHHGYLFGGAVLKWVDEFAWLTASLDFPGCTLVTMAMNDIVFRKRIVNGAILRFRILPQRTGNTSVTYRVTVYADEPGAEQEIDVFSTQVTFVRLDEQGRKASLPNKGSLRSQFRDLG
jgi:acyl-CoA hydrolase